MDTLTAAKLFFFPPPLLLPTRFPFNYPPPPPPPPQRRAYIVKVAEADVAFYVRAGPSFLFFGFCG